MEGIGRVCIGASFTVYFATTSGRAHFEIPQDMVQRWHDNTHYGRNSEHDERALDVDTAICAPSLHLPALKRPLYYYR